MKWFKLLLQNPDPPETYLDPGPTDNGGLPFEYSPVDGEPPETNLDTTGPTDNGGLPSEYSPIFVPPFTTPAERTAVALRELGIPPVTLVADFLSDVREITLKSIERVYPSGWVREAKMSYVLTVPTIWTDATKYLMVEAAEKAGFGTHRVDFHFVSESDAAAGLFTPSFLCHGVC